MNSIPCATIRRYDVITFAPEVAQLKAFLLRRWKRITHPIGHPRIWNPGRWRWNERILVLGESIALIAAVMALASELLHWRGTNWFLLTTPIVGSASLLWYAWDTVSIGDRPLTPVSIQNIRRVVQGVMLEDAGAVVDWQNPDDQGAIQMRLE